MNSATSPTILCVLALSCGLLLPSQALAVKPWVPGEVVITSEGSSKARVVELEPGESVSEGVARFERHDPALTAAPNYRLSATGFRPNDPGYGQQWNLQRVGAEAAWARLASLGVPGARGVTVAVIDTGLAGYQQTANVLKKRCGWEKGRAAKTKKRGPARRQKAKGPIRRPAKAKARWVCKKQKKEVPVGWERRAPDWDPARIAPGRDFIDDDAIPYDMRGHGTHVASTIAESTNNGQAYAGLAYGVRVMPVRVLDASGSGNSADLANGIRWAVSHRADVINLSLGFGPGVGANEVPAVAEALDYAEQQGVVVTAAAGNDGIERVGYPASHPPVISVAASTPQGRLADYSNWSTNLDIAAPGGGDGADIWQVGMISSDPAVGIFFGGVGLRGTSMATPHVAAGAAMVIAARRATGHDPSPAEVRSALAAAANCGLRTYAGQDFAARYGRCVQLDVAGAVGV